MQTKTEVKHTPIPQIPGYSATHYGQIWSTQSNWRGYGSRPLVQILNGRGYLKVRIKMTNGKRRNLSVHSLIASTFLPLKPSINFEIRHLNGNRLDNRVANLAWGTRKDNANDREKHGHTSRGVKHSLAIKRGLIARAEGGKI